MFRVYDTKEEKWVDSDCVLVSGFNDDMYIREKSRFGWDKLVLVSHERYVIHREIGVNDVNGVPIFEGDVCDVELYNDAGTVRCVVAYVPDHAGYFLFSDEKSCYYGFNEEFDKRLAVVGNVFDASDMEVDADA